MNLAILTSNEHRHRYFANYLAGQLPVSVVVAEPKVANPASGGRNEEEDRLLAEYFDDRLRAEQAILAGGERFTRPEGVVLVETAPAKVNDPMVLEGLRANGVDTLAVFGTSLLRDPLLSAFPGRIFNIHLGLSPYYRGSGTNFWALYNEDLHLVGATIHYIDPGVDTGEIICHVRAPILPDDTPHTIGNKVIKETVHTMVDVLRRIEHGPVPSVAQWKPEVEHVYRRRDFTADALRDLLARWKTDLVRRFLERQPPAGSDLRLVSLPKDDPAGR